MKHKESIKQYFIHQRKKLADNLHSPVSIGKQYITRKSFLENNQACTAYAGIYGISIGNTIIYVHLVTLGTITRREKIYMHTLKSL